MFYQEHFESFSRAPRAQKKTEMIEEMTRFGGKHIIFVAYGEHHYLRDEWGYNGADLNQAPVLWARWVDWPDMNRRLADFLKRGRYGF